MAIREFISRLLPIRRQRPPMPEGMTEVQQELWAAIPKLSQDQLLKLMAVTPHSGRSMERSR